jgi:hypothetical protein
MFESAKMPKNNKSDNALTVIETVEISTDTLDEQIQTCTKKLTLREIAYVNEYLNTNNDQELAKKLLGVTHNKAMANPWVNQLIKLREYEKQLASTVSRERIILELWAIASVNVLDFFEAESADIPLTQKGDAFVIRDISKLSRTHGAAIKSIKRVGDNYEVRFHDKLMAMSQLTKLLGADEDKGNSPLKGLPNKIEINFVDRRPPLDGTSAKTVIQEAEYEVVDTRVNRES